MFHKLCVQNYIRNIIQKKIDNTILRLSWKESKCLGCRSNIHYTFKLHVYDKLFYFDKTGLSSELLSESSLETGQKLNPKFSYVSTDVFYSGL